MPVHPMTPERARGWGRPAALALLMPLLAALLAPAVVAQDTPEEVSLRAAVEARIAPDSGRGTIRLPRVSLDAAGDATVIVSLRDLGSVEGIRAAATEDVAAILDAVYHAPGADRVRTLTVIGTFPITGTRGTRELRTLRVVLSAERAAAIAWDSLAPTTLAEQVDLWRFYPPFGPDAAGLDTGGQAPAAPASGPLPAPPGLPTAAVPAAEAAAPEAIISSLIDIGGRRLFLRCIGAGGPTVLLEAGYGDDGTIWSSVQLRVSEFARVCSYDRAGLHRSDRVLDLPRTGADVVADLHALLAAADVPGPYVLVGHSYGGLYSRLFAATYPAEVAGLVLVDAWHEDFDAALRALVTPAQEAAFQALLAADPDHEVVDLGATYAQVRAAPLPADLPLIVLSHGRQADAACCPPGWPIIEQEELWQKLQGDLVGLVPGAERVVAAESGHAVHYEQPELVVDAVRRLVEGAATAP